LAEGVDGLSRLLAGAHDVVDYWLDTLAPSLVGFSDLHGRLRRAEELLRFVAGVPNALLREAWVKRVAERLRLDPSALKQELQKRTGPTGATSAASRSTPPPPAQKKSSGPRTVRSAEEEVLQMVGSHPEVWGTTPLEETLFSDERCRRVVRCWEEDRREGRKIDPAAVLTLLPEPDAAWWSALLMEDKRFEVPVDDFARGVARLHGLALARERKSLEPDVLGMLEGRIPRDEQKILRYQTLTRETRTRTSDAAGRTMER
jgi:DNA primase